MIIEDVVWLEHFVEKLVVKHHVTTLEVEEVLMNQAAKFRFVEKGDRPNENLYMGLGQTSAGRYLAVLFIYKTTPREALVISARDMADKERKLYGRK